MCPEMVGDLGSTGATDIAWSIWSTLGLAIGDGARVFTLGASADGASGWQVGTAPREHVSSDFNNDSTGCSSRIES